MCREKRLKRGRGFLKRALAATLAAVLLASGGFAVFPAVRSPVSAQAEENDGGLSEHMISTVSPTHVKFNLFDYWMVERDTSSDNRPLQGGINEGHSFVFGGVYDAGAWNSWTGTPEHYNFQVENTNIPYGIYPGIVSGQLRDGYPVLSLEDDYPENGRPTPDFISNNSLQGTLTESLDYLFDPDIENEYKAVYENVQGLVKYDGSGGYIYSSHDNYAAFREMPDGTSGSNGEQSDGYFEVYDSWAVRGGSSPNGQFFPFDGADEVFEKDQDGNYTTDSDGHLVPKEMRSTDEQGTLNHFMGLTMETVFLQPENGRLDENTPMSFTFSGDDDVWIFIDDVLVSDLGGVHDECFTVIDFEKGIVYTGLTPIVQNDDGTYSEDVPTLEELRNTADDQSGWKWYDRSPANLDKPWGDRVGMKDGTYGEFKEAHDIQARSLREIFRNAGQEGNQSWGDGTNMAEATFDRNTQHELHMFYLERGAGASNLVLSFNMVAVPGSGITKTDQDGRPVEGAEFALWPAKVNNTEKDEYGHAAPVIGADGLYIADKEKDSGVPICRGSTDENGHLVFVTEKQKIISFQERAQNGEFYYVLEEISHPVGYRSKGDISLYYSMYNPKNPSEGVLLSYNYWQTGAYTQAMLDVTMTEKLYRYELDESGTPVAKTPLVPEGEDADKYLENGIIFAVPVKRMDMDGSLYEESNYHALYGTVNTGWTLMTESIKDKKSVLEAAKGMEQAIHDSRQPGGIIAGLNARSLYQVEITNIPGDVKLSYPYLMGSGRENESQYNIVFYFAPNAGSLDEIKDPETLVHIGAFTPEGDMFERQYASQVYISNTFNRVRVQKLDYHGSRLDNAEFSMYQTYSVQDRDGEGTLYVWDESKSLYRNTAFVNDDGTLKPRAEIISAEPWDKGMTRSGGSAGPGSLELEGAFIFPTAFDEYIFSDQHLTQDYQVDPGDTSTYIEEGEYVIFETGAPSDGYRINETPVMVTVSGDGVLADAGEVNDGVRSGKYAGWILNSMTLFAAEGTVDESLTFLSSTLKVQGENGGTEPPLEGDITWLNKYSNENYRYILFAEDVGRYVTDGRNLYQFTDKGVPQLQIRQNSAVNAKTMLLEGEYKNYSGMVTIKKKNTDGTVTLLRSNAVGGTLSFWLRKDGHPKGGQTLEGVEIDGETLAQDIDYHIYEPHVEDLSGYEDLSGLFSIETLIQVQDQSVGGLTVSKKTEYAAPGSDADSELFFYRVYGVYEHATRIVLAETEGGVVKKGEDGTPVLNRTFDGTLNVRLRERTEDGNFQMTETNVAVDFTDGIGLIYLEPSYSVEHVYIPENAEHPAYGLTGLVETRITLDDPADGVGEETGRHIALDGTDTCRVEFEDGAGVFYNNPNFTVEKVELGGNVYYADPSGGQKGLEATSRINYASIGNVQNLEVHDTVPVAFTEADGTPSGADQVVTETDNSNATVRQDGSGGYLMEYSPSSDTHKQTVVAQFALRAGQAIHIKDLAGGTVYYVYEYAAGNDASPDRLARSWNTEIKVTPQGADGGSGEVEEGEDYIISDRYPENPARAARGIIRTNAEQRVDFTNSGRVGSLRISKTVAGDQATDEDREKEFSFTVTLKDADGNPLKGTYPYTGDTTAAGVSAPADGKLTLDGSGSGTVMLGHGQSITVGNIPKGTAYAVSESGDDGFSVVVDDDTDGDGAAEGTVAENAAAAAVFTNIRQSALVFTKVDAEDLKTPLPGAEFTLYRLDCKSPGHDHSSDTVSGETGCWRKENSVTGGTDGKVSFGNLARESVYCLAETKAPDGFALPEGQWRITTNADGEIKIEAAGTQEGRLPTAFAVDKETGALLLPNARPAAIPSSGGWGVVLYRACGGLLMLAAVGILAVRRLRGRHLDS